MKFTEEIVFFIIIVLCIFAAFFSGLVIGISEERRDAVKLGMAHYTANEDGFPKFEYKKF